MESSLFVGNPLQTSGDQYLLRLGDWFRQQHVFCGAGRNWIHAELQCRLFDDWWSQLYGRPQGSSPRATWNDWQYAG